MNIKAIFELGVSKLSITPTNDFESKLLGATIHADTEGQIYVHYDKSILSSNPSVVEVVIRNKEPTPIAEPKRIVDLDREDIEKLDSRVFHMYGLSKDDLYDLSRAFTDEFKRKNGL